MSQSSPIIKVRVETHYGRKTTYPVCETAKKLASLAGTKTLTPKALQIIQELGYEIQVQPVSLELLTKEN